MRPRCLPPSFRPLPHGNPAVAGPSSFTFPLSEAQARRLEQRLHDGTFEPHAVAYARAAGSKPGLAVVLYTKGPKVVVQGKQAEEFVRFVLEPEILGAARLGYEEVTDPEQFTPHFGIDESGKGDFFGPLVIAGVYTDEAITRGLLQAGVTDSKRIGSDRRIRELAATIRSLPGIACDVVSIGPEKYNELYAGFRNVNRLLAWGHARVIENLCALRPDCPRTLSDQFAANPRTLVSALMEQGRRLQFQQRTKAEADPAVAAASILARERFIDWLGRAADRLAQPLPKGGGHLVTQAARDLVQRHGAEVLPRVAKMHFRNASGLTPPTR